ncbi:hypothetical protein VR46_30215 [Streptomyces sp. NRRL S-444]|nr:hypothetical protein VR46_30215 [Streptomyces sp. NRRL S-444]
MPHHPGLSTQLTDKYSSFVVGEKRSNSPFLLVEVQSGTCGRQHPPLRVDCGQCPCLHQQLVATSEARFIESIEDHTDRVRLWIPDTKCSCRYGFAEALVNLVGSEVDRQGRCTVNARSINVGEVVSLRDEGLARPVVSFDHERAMPRENGRTTLRGPDQRVPGKIDSHGRWNPGRHPAVDHALLAALEQRFEVRPLEALPKRSQAGVVNPLGPIPTDGLRQPKPLRPPRAVLSNHGSAHYAHNLRVQCFEGSLGDIGTSQLPERRSVAQLDVATARQGPDADELEKYGDGLLIGSEPGRNAAQTSSVVCAFPACQQAEQRILRTEITL